MFNLMIVGAIALILILLVGLLVIILKEYRRGDEEFDDFIKQTSSDLSSETESSHTPSNQEPSPTEQPTPQKQTSDDAKPSEPISVIPAMETEPKEQIPEPTPTPNPNQELIHSIETKEYAAFKHDRLIEMGLSHEEADEFVIELVHQLEEAVDQIETALLHNELSKVEHITHGIKGAASNVGTGGVTDLLVDYNTYMKSGRDITIIQAYQKRLKECISDLKVEFSQVA
ncbi:MAG: hypothetical protein DSY46_02070 [Hydrogenimonas sp.]|nr:MAG: hypothetical protein DSY46_02070 [Hydrogenimonas sp.]